MNNPRRGKSRSRYALKSEQGKNPALERAEETRRAGHPPPLRPSFVGDLPPPPTRRGLRSPPGSPYGDRPPPLHGEHEGGSTPVGPAQAELRGFSGFFEIPGGEFQPACRLGFNRQADKRERVRCRVSFERRRVRGLRGCGQLRSIREPTSADDPGQSTPRRWLGDDR